MASWWFWSYDLCNFFFSSRRRHTRYWRDWSSDVCSSDLQRGRVEYARGGGRVNTDAIDNSAGVDTSDHEVNIKILLDRIVQDGDLTEKQRNTVLEIGRAHV